MPKKLEEVVLQVRTPQVRTPGSFIKDWLAVGIAGFSLIFSAGGWYFKISELEKKINEVQVDYVRKDVQGVTLDSIDRRLTNMENSMSKLDVKLDSVTVTLGTPRR